MRFSNDDIVSNFKIKRKCSFTCKLLLTYQTPTNEFTKYLRDNGKSVIYFSCLILLGKLMLVTNIDMIKYNYRLYYFYM